MMVHYATDMCFFCPPEDKGVTIVFVRRTNTDDKGVTIPRTK